MKNKSEFDDRNELMDDDGGDSCVVPTNENENKKQKHVTIFNH